MKKIQLNGMHAILCFLFLSLHVSCNKESLTGVDNEDIELKLMELAGVFDDQSYYWHGKEKIYFELDESLALMEFGVRS